MRDEPFNRARDGFGRVGRYQKSRSAVINQIFASGIARHDNRQTASHCLLLNERATFHDRWQDQYITCAHQVEYALWLPRGLVNEICKLLAIKRHGHER